MLWILIVFKADSNPSFYFNSDPDLDRGWPDSAVSKRKLNFYMEILYVVNRTWTNYVRTPFWKDWKSRFFVNFGQYTCSWIRIRTYNTDPGTSNQWGSGLKHWVVSSKYSVLLLKALLFGTTFNLWHRYHFNLLPVVGLKCYTLRSTV